VRAARDAYEVVVLRRAALEARVSNLLKARRVFCRELHLKAHSADPQVIRDGLSVCGKETRLFRDMPEQHLAKLAPRPRSKHENKAQRTIERPFGDLLQRPTQLGQRLDLARRKIELRIAEHLGKDVRPAPVDPCTLGSTYGTPGMTGTKLPGGGRQARLIRARF